VFSLKTEKKFDTVRFDVFEKKAKTATPTHINSEKNELTEPKARLL